MLLKYIKLIIAFACSIIYWSGIYNGTRNLHENKCNMTFMFEHSQYIKIKMKNNSFKRYKLYVYGEGPYAAELGSGLFWGLPVLFIPGNKGSFKQVRSLASVAYRKTLTGYPFHFDFFTVDFAEELGAFDGPILERQTSFVSEAISTILALYRKRLNGKSKSVVIVGHSLGGLVARAVVAFNNGVASSVPLIVTLATPHVRPVLILDRTMESFYLKVNEKWEADYTGRLKDVTFVTVGGGPNDVLVPTSFTTHPLADVDVTLMSVPMCWLTTDHLAIVWCKQLVFSILRALFDSVDVQKNKISIDKSIIVRAFRNRLLEAHYPTNLPHEELLSKMASKGDLIHVKALNFSAFYKSTNRKAFAVTLLSQYREEGAQVTFVFRGGRSRFSLLSCFFDLSNSTNAVSVIDDLNHYIRLIPGDAKEANIDLRGLEGSRATHLVLYAEIGGETGIEIDVHIEGVRSCTLTAPQLFLDDPVSLDVPPKSLTFNITIENWTEYWQSFYLEFEPNNGCFDHELRLAVSVRSPGSERWSYALPYKRSLTKFILEFESPPTVDFDDVEVHVVKNIGCDVTLSLHPNYEGVIQRAALVNISQLPSFIICQLLLILAQQYKGLPRGRLPFISRWFSLSPLFVLPFVKIISFGLSKYPLMETDLMYLTRHRMETQVSLIFLYLASLPVTTLLLVVVRGVVESIAQIWNRVFKRFHASGTAESDSGVGSTALMVALFSIVLMFSSTFSLYLTAVFALIKVVAERTQSLRISEDSSSPSETSVQNPTSSELEDSSSDIHSVIFTLNLLVAALHFPSLISSIADFRYEMRMDFDCGFLLSLSFILSSVSLWHVTVFDSNKRWYGVIGYGVHTAAVLVLLFGTVHLYIISEVAAATLLLVGLHQHLKFSR